MLSPEPQSLLPIGPLALALAPEVIDLAASGLQTYFDDRAGEYVASWGATRVGEDFYKSDTSLEFAYKGFELRRQVLNDARIREEAAVLGFSFRLNEEHTLMSVIPTRVMLKKAKARLAQRDAAADLLVEISLKGWWKNKNGSIKSKQLGDASLLLREIRLGEHYTLATDGEQTYLEDGSGNKSNFNIQSGWMIPVPVSVSPQGNRLMHARGNYVLSVQITEIDEAGKRVDRFGYRVYQGRGLVKDLIEEIDD